MFCLRRQRRLFDDTKEGEKVMTLLTSISPGDLANMLHPILIQVNKINHFDLILSKLNVSPIVLISFHPRLATTACWRPVTTPAPRTASPASTRTS